MLLAAKLNPSSDIVDWQKFLATDIDIQFGERNIILVILVQAAVNQVKIVH